VSAQLNLVALPPIPLARVVKGLARLVMGYVAAGVLLIRDRTAQRPLIAPPPLLSSYGVVSSIGENEAYCRRVSPLWVLRLSLRARADPLPINRSQWRPRVLTAAGCPL
jgi:hypothetical protein